MQQFYRIKFVYEGGQATLKLPATKSLEEVQAWANNYAQTLQFKLNLETAPTIEIQPPAPEG